MKTVADLINSFY